MSPVTSNNFYRNFQDFLTPAESNYWSNESSASFLWLFKTGWLAITIGFKSLIKNIAAIYKGKKKI